MGRQTTRVVLVASLALNLFLVAAFVAMILWNARSFNRAAPPGPLRLVAASLDATHRQALLAVLRGNGQRVRPLNRKAKALRQDAWEALEDPAFDPAAIKVKLAEARALNQQASGIVQDSLIDFAAALPADQRAALGKALVARLPPPRTSSQATSIAAPNLAPKKAGP
jgi:uncharacterized membrane protein